MPDKEFIVEKDGKQFVDVVKLLPDKTSDIREIIKEVDGDKVTIYSRIRAKSKGSGSKKVTINRFIELDELFFEGLGLWVAEGTKSKGIYFGNTCLEILQKFIEFVENRIGVSRDEFKVRIILPAIQEPEEIIKKRWSKILQINLGNFTRFSILPKTNLEYVYFYFNSEILVDLLKRLCEELKLLVVRNFQFSSAFMRGVIAGEAQVELKLWGTLSYISISCKDTDEVRFYEECLKSLDIKISTYDKVGMKFPIYGKQNFDKIQEFRLMDLHPKKKSKFERGLKNYQRIVDDPEIIEKLILQLLETPKTYNELKEALNKGRSTIQAFYIPRLEKKGLIKRIGKRKQAWLFQKNNNDLSKLILP